MRLGRNKRIAKKWCKRWLWGNAEILDPATGEHYWATYADAWAHWREIREWRQHPRAR